MACTDEQSKENWMNRGSWRCAFIPFQFSVGSSGYSRHLLPPTTLPLPTPSLTSSFLPFPSHCMSELVGVGGEVPTVRGGSEEGKELGDGVGGSVRELPKGIHHLTFMSLRNRASLRGLLTIPSS